MIAIGFVTVAAVFTLARAVATAGQTAGEVPWRTLTVNVGGAFALGLITASTWIENPLLIATAGLGSLTTFSTAVAETSSLLENGGKRRAVAYAALTVVLGIAAAWLALIVGDSL